MTDARYAPIIADLVRASAEDERLCQLGTTVAAHQYVRLYDLVHRYVPSGSRVLDWGAGGGHFSFFLARSGFRADAFSLEAPPRICAGLPPDRYTFTAGDPSNPVALPYEDESFDAVASVGVLEHVRETGGEESASLREIFRVLKPGGTFLCFHFPNQYSWIDLAARSVGRWAHTYRYTAPQVRSLAEGAGFSMLEMRRYAAIPRNIWAWGLPQSIGASPTVARVYDRIDHVVGSVLSPICQNYLFVGRKPSILTARHRDSDAHEVDAGARRLKSPVVEGVQ